MRSAVLGSVPVVSTSTTTNSWPAFTASTKSTTDPVPGSRYGRTLALPTASRSWSWSSTMGRSAWWPKRMASAMTSSGRILAPASTIMIASRVPETMRSSSDSASWLYVGLIDELAVDAADADGADRTLERDLADRQRRRRGDRPEDVGVVLLVGREDRDDALDVVLVALREQRPDRPVRQAGRQDGRLGRSRLALDEAARDLARGIHPLLEVDREREEVEPGARVRPIGGAEHHRVTVADGDGSAGQPGELAGLDGQRSATELRLEYLRHGVMILLVVRRSDRDSSWPTWPRLLPDTIGPRASGPRSGSGER